MKTFKRMTAVIVLILFVAMVFTGCKSIGDKILDEVEDQINNSSENGEKINLDTNIFDLNADDKSYKELTGDFDDLLVVKPKGDVTKVEDEVFIIMSYESSQGGEKLKTYFKDLFEDTKGYYMISTETGLILMGKINESIVTVSVTTETETPLVEISISDYAE